MINIGDKFIEQFTVSAEVHQGFIALFGDRHPLHTNAKFANERGFRAEVMHGNILNGFLSYFIGECLPEREVMIMSQEIKFQRPVYMGDQLTLEASVVDIHDSVNLIEFAYKFRNAADGKAVATGKINIVKTAVTGEK